MKTFTHIPRAGIPGTRHFITLAEAYGDYVNARRHGGFHAATLVDHWTILNIWAEDDAAEELLPDCPDCGMPMSPDGHCGGCERGWWRFG